MPVFYVVLGVLALILIICLVQMKKGAAWGKPAVTIIAILAILTAVINMVMQNRETGYQPDYKLYAIIGEELAKNFSEYLPSGGKVTVLTPYDPDATPPNPRHTHYMQGFKSGFSSKNVSITGVVAIPQMEPTEMEVTLEDYEARLQQFYKDTLAENSGIAGFISLGRLPANLDAPGLKIALIGGMSPEVSKLIQEGQVQTVVAGTPEVHVVKKGEEIPLETVFKTRYMVVTPENLDQILDRYPQFNPSAKE